MRFHRLILLVVFIPLLFVACEKGPGVRAPWTASGANQGILGGVSGGVPVTPPVVPLPTPVVTNPARALLNIKNASCGVVGVDAEKGTYEVTLSWLTTVTDVEAVELRVNVVDLRDDTGRVVSDFENPNLIYKVADPDFEGTVIVSVPMDAAFIKEILNFSAVTARAIVNYGDGEIISNDAFYSIDVGCNVQPFNVTTVLTQD